MKKISIITPSYNEEDNVGQVVNKVKDIFSKELKGYVYEHIFIDNASTDKTVEILCDIAKVDKNVKIIVNSRNFGHIKSPYHGLIQADGDAVILLVSDLQDPVELIVDFVREWENGFLTVIGVKNKSKESSLMFFIRKIYYRILRKLSDVDIVENFTGFGLYDRKVVDILTKVKDPEPFLRGVISYIGLKTIEIEYTQPKREKGKSKNNFYTLYDIGILGIISNSKIPIRITIFFGFFIAFTSFVIGLVYLIAKLIVWEDMALGLAPIIVGQFFLFGMVFMFMGILGEYIGAIYIHVLDRPKVVEEKRINFDK